MYEKCSEKIFKIIAVTNRHLSAGDYYERVEKIAASGADMIIVREKDMSPEEYEALARRVMAICSAYGTECVLHTFVDVARRLRCRKIHLPLSVLRQLSEGSSEKENSPYLRRTALFSTPLFGADTDGHGADEQETSARCKPALLAPVYSSDVSDTGGNGKISVFHTAKRSMDTKEKVQTTAAHAEKHDKETSPLSTAQHQAQGLHRWFELVGASVHSAAEAREAERLGADYVTAGHIFVTECKKNVMPRGISFLKEVIRAVSIPVYAIGGISAGNLDLVREAEAAGACIMSQMMRGDFYEKRVVL